MAIIKTRLEKIHSTNSSKTINDIVRYVEHKNFRFRSDYLSNRGLNLMLEKCNVEIDVLISILMYMARCMSDTSVTIYDIDTFNGEFVIDRNYTSYCTQRDVKNVELKVRKFLIKRITNNEINNGVKTKELFFSNFNIFNITIVNPLNIFKPNIIRLSEDYFEQNIVKSHNSMSKNVDNILLNLLMKSVHSTFNEWEYNQGEWSNGFYRIVICESAININKPFTLSINCLEEESKYIQTVLSMRSKSNKLIKELKR